MKPLSGRAWSAGYAFHAFNVVMTDKEFSFSRLHVPSPAAGSNVSAVCTQHLHESVINGVLQGRKQTDPRGASALCNVRMWEVASSVVESIETYALQDKSKLSTYRRIKNSELFEDRRGVKEEAKAEVLKGWVRNVKDDFEVQSWS